jgi:ferric enterobactin receptor
MMKIVLRFAPALLFGSFFLFALTSLAQEASKGRITGRIIDSISKNPLEYATISVYKENNSRPVNGTSTNVKGVFILDGLEAGTYHIKIEFIGYKTRSLGPLVLGGKTTTLMIGDIVLPGKATDDLQSVTVLAPQSLVENKIDKLVYNAEKDISSQGGVATDILKKVPMVSVDVDGNVELMGNSNILFLINGKPSSIFGNSLADALASIPASQIKAIEVITSPGAKYDAEGTGGIINIVLKENRLKGINGNISLAAGSRLENGSLNLNARHGNFGMNAFFNGNTQLTSTTLNHSDRISTDTAGHTQTALVQDGSSRFDRGGYEGGLGFDWSINKRNNFTGSIGYDHFGNKNIGFLNEDQAQYAQPSDTLSAMPSLLHSENRFSAHSVDLSLDYKKTFVKEDQELDISYQSSTGTNSSSYTQGQSLPSGDSVFSGSRSNSNGSDHQYNFHIDYVQPFGENTRLETGVRFTRRPISSVSDVYTLDPATGAYPYDTSQSNSLVYTRHVYAGYASLLFPAGKFLKVKAGLRYERTETDATFSKAPGFAIPGYNTFAPSLTLAHEFENGQILKIAYTKRIQRPDYRSLNPFVNASDPKNLSRGNPYLQPEIANNIDLTYTKSFEKGSVLNLVLYYHRSDQDIQPFIVYYPSFQLGDSVYTDVSVNTPMNVGSENNFGLNVFGSVPLGPKWNVRTNIFVFDRYITTGSLGGSAVNSLNYRINMNADYQISKTLVAEFFGNFNSARNEIQGRYPSFTSYNFAFRKQFWNKKGSLAFTTTNPFSSYVNQATAVNGQDFTLNSLRRIPFRSFGVNFTWKFGKLEFKKDKEQEPEKENPAPSDQ